MRIQHNIMAMSAYRNYTNNVSAMKSNLEKLSSGYKINRAGDDAAGLAISEKMRAQITGLETAQKNAKDGISLVQTAEGALTEVHDMLNRMVELATQSANGTYDNDTDRAQLQKEMDQLRSEINRIADSSNFNGIKLLDGSMDASAITGVEYSEVSSSDILNKLLTNTDWTGKDQLDVDAGKGVLETESVASSKAAFQISLDNIGSVAGGQDFHLVIGTEDTAITLDAGNYTATTLAQAIAEKLKNTGLDYDNANYKVTADGNTLKFESDAEVQLDTSAKVSWYTGDTPPDPTDTSVKYTVDMSSLASGTGALANGDKITIADQDFTFNTDLATTLDGQTVTNGNDTYTLEFDSTTNTLTIVDAAGTAAAPTVSSTPAGTPTTVTGANPASGVTGAAASGTPSGTVNSTTGTLAIGGETVVSAGAFTGTAINGITSDGQYDWDVDNSGNVTITATTAGSAGNGTVSVDINGAGASNVTLSGGVDAVKGTADYDLSAFATAAKGSLSVGADTVNWDTDLATTIAQLDTTSYDYTLNGTTLTITAKSAATGTDAPTNISWTSAATTNATVTKVEQPKMGYIDHGMQNPTSYVDASAAQVANATVDFNAVGAWADGSKITIGDTTYTVAVGADSKFQNASNVIDLSDMETVDTKVAAQRLAVAAADNSIFTVGHNGEGKTTIQQKTSVKDTTDMTTKEKLASYLGVSVADPESLENAKAGTALTLQIGDTADSYNQLTVDIKDCHTDSLGIANISIADQDSAANAVDAIKNAINYVSDVRGTLGATQNRLDHTINNLSVMTENIQDAESTIRDVDVAEEMMEYTKNNILIQASQAMLAQANQVPQGVLQLLQ